MQRLNFQLPDFTRLAWVSDHTQAIWEPRLQRITRAWQEIEWLAVVAGVRRCGLTSVTPQELIEKAGRCAERGLTALPLQMQGINSSVYASTTIGYEAGKPFIFRIVVGKPEDVTEFKVAYDDADDEAMSDLLGYPECCMNFFKKVWVEEAMVDTTWPMAVRTDAIQHGDLIEVEGPPESNILWRWMGVRAVPHLPCSFTCEATLQFAHNLIEVGRDAGYEQEMDWLLDVLSWPVEWSALHGIAEIKTPVVKVSTRTDATPTKYTVQYRGQNYPEEGAQGLAFPYQSPLRPAITFSNSYQRGIQTPLETSQSYPIWYASDNGFTSIIGMNRAHDPILKLAASVLENKAGDFVDLGCGNAALLRKIYELYPDTTPYGVDISADKIAHASTWFPKFADNFFACDIFNDDALWKDDHYYSLALLMPGRLLEVSTGQAEWLREQLISHCDNILVYAYGDWLTQYGSLAGLADQAGFQLKTNGEYQQVGLVNMP